MFIFILNYMKMLKNISPHQQSFQNKNFIILTPQPSQKNFSEINFKSNPKSYSPSHKFNNNLQNYYLNNNNNNSFNKEEKKTSINHTFSPIQNYIIFPQNNFLISNFNQQQNSYFNKSAQVKKKINKKLDPQQDIYPNRYDNYEQFQKITPSMLEEMLYHTEMYIYNNYKHLIDINEKNKDLELSSYSKFFIIKSFNEEDIHKSIKYNVWSSSKNGNKTLNNAYNSIESDNKNIYLFFSCNGSGKYIGVAKMISNVNFNQSFSYWTQDNIWKGLFNVEWVFLKDIPFTYFKEFIIQMKDGRNLPVTYSRDTQEIPFDIGCKMIEIFKKFKNKFSILECMEFYDIRQENYEYNIKKSKEQFESNKIAALNNNNMIFNSIKENRTLDNNDNDKENKYSNMQKIIQKEMNEYFIKMRNAQITNMKNIVNLDNNNSNNVNKVKSNLKVYNNKKFQNYYKKNKKDNNNNNYEFIKQKLLDNYQKIIEKEKIEKDSKIEEEEGKFLENNKIEEEKKVDEKK